MHSGVEHSSDGGATACRKLLSNLLWVDAASGLELVGNLRELALQCLVDLRNYILGCGRNGHLKRVTQDGVLPLLSLCFGRRRSIFSTRWSRSSLSPCLEEFRHATARPLISAAKELTFQPDESAVEGQARGLAELLAWRCVDAFRGHIRARWQVCHACATLAP